MRRLRNLIGALLILVLLIVAGFIWKRSIEIEVNQRTAHFITLQFIAESAARTDLDEVRPKNISDLMESRGGLNSPLLAPFPDGLIYEPTESGFILREPSPRPVSFFRSDYLVGSDKEWPHWHSTGELIRKFEGQKIPEGYLSTTAFTK